MPTGYTDKIEHGMKFKDYVLTCARAFGALYDMRDAPEGTDIVLEAAPSSFYEDRLKAAHERYESIYKMTIDDLRDDLLSTNEKEERSHQAVLAKINKLSVMYGTMLDQVNNWKPPSPEHEQLKAFMIDQLQSSIKFDCEKPRPLKLRAHTPIEWREILLKEANDDIARYTRLQDEELQRVKARNLWVSQLVDSLVNLNSTYVDRDGKLRDRDGNLFTGVVK